VTAIWSKNAKTVTAVCFMPVASGLLASPLNLKKLFVTLSLNSMIDTY